MLLDRPRPSMSWGRVAAVGVLAGITSGLFGVGGGIVMVPGLALIAGFGHKLATGTSLGAIVPISATALVGYAWGGEVDWAAALWVGLGAVPGAVIGARLLAVMRTNWLQVLFAGIMFAAAVQLILEDAEGSGRSDLTAGLAVAMVLLGLVSGLLAGLFGVGGGILIVPVITLLIGMPHVLAKGTSLAVILPTAIVGTLQNRSSGLTALRSAAVVGLVGSIAAAIASLVSLELDAKVSQILFAILQVAVAVRLVVASRRGEREAEGEGEV